MRTVNRLGCRGLPLLLLTVPLSAAAQEGGDRPWTAERAAEELAYTTGVHAYLYGFPVVEMYRVRHSRVFDPGARNRQPLNELRHARALLDHTATTVVSPNNDTLYSGAWLDLAKEPVVLHVPDTNGRYYVFQFLDFFTNNFAFVGKRTTGTREGNFVIVGPGWKGTVPAGLRRIDAPTNAVWLLGRTLVDGEKDLKNVHALQDQYTLTPLSAWGKNTPLASAEARPAPPPYDLSDPLQFFAILNAGLRENPPPARDAALMSLFGQIGIGPDKTFQVDQLSAATARGLRRAVSQGAKILAARAAAADQPTASGWVVPRRHIGNFGDDYLYRAHIARVALAALTPEEAVYLRTATDDRGRPLNGKRRYVLRFGPGQLPPVDAFWSITLYRLPERLLAANPIGRYAVGDRTPRLRYDQDGSLTIYLQHDSPGREREANWLPAPAGDFDLMLRCFLPRQPITAGRWVPPAVKAVE